MSNFKPGDRVRLKGTSIEGEVHYISPDEISARVRFPFTAYDMRASCVRSDALELVTPPKPKPTLADVLQVGDIVETSGGVLYYIDHAGRLNGWRSAPAWDAAKVYRPTLGKPIWVREEERDEARAAIARVRALIGNTVGPIFSGTVIAALDGDAATKGNK